MSKINDKKDYWVPKHVLETPWSDNQILIQLREVAPGSVTITREEFRKLVSKSYMNRQKDVDAEALEVHMFGHE